MVKIDDIIMNNTDNILVVDKDYNIVFNSRYRFGVDLDTSQYSEKDYVGRNFLEIFPDIDPRDSTVVAAMKTGKIIYRKNQEFIDYKGKYFKTHNITIPIIHSGNIVGAIEMVKDVTTIEDVMEQEKSNKEVLSMGERIGDDLSNRLFTFHDILTQDKNMLQSIESAKEMAQLDNPMLIYGETGTGKEMFAQAIIDARHVAPENVVMQNCAAIPDTLIEATLFGTSKGAFTGAEKTKGLFRQANNGVIFLDELNALSYQVQGKLLRVLQEGTFRPVGSQTEVKVKTKVIATINKDPLEAIAEKSLRDDLFYRLSSCMIHLTPLRDRPDDILYYINSFIMDMSRQYDKTITGLTPGLIAQLEELDWPGNVRELKHVIESMVSRTVDGVLSVENLPAYLLNRIRKNDNNSSLKIEVPSNLMNLKSVLENTEKRLIFQALRVTKGNKSQAAELLGIPRQTLNYRLQRYHRNHNDDIND